MVVSGGGIAVLDANNAILFSQGAYSPAGTPAGTLPAKAVLTQVRLLFRGALGAAGIKAGIEMEGTCCAGFQAVLRGRHRVPDRPVRRYVTC